VRSDLIFIICNFYLQMMNNVAKIRMIPRTLEAKLHELAGHYPAVAFTGPRQSGKTTLCAGWHTRANPMSRWRRWISGILH